jgi:CRISPR-associated protein Cas5d
MSRGFWIEVGGDFACFTRPEMKVERVSYDVITPSAARGIFEAIFWKPAIRWVIKKIQVLNAVHWISVRRNEVAKIASTQSKSSIFIEDDRQQRAGLFLRNVQYRIHGEFVLVPPENRQKIRYAMPESMLETDFEEYADWQKNPPVENHAVEAEAKYAAMFERRAKKGQYFTKPYLGCREFAADVRLVDDIERETKKPLNMTQDFGFMLYDLDYTDPQNIQPLFFRANMVNGVIRVPDRNSEDVKG